MSLSSQFRWVARFATVATLFLVADATSAAGRCALSDTQRQCLARYEAATETEIAQAAKSNVAERSATANTGNANASNALPTSSFTDFFNTLQTNASAGSDSADDPQAFAFELNHCGVPRLPGQAVACQLRGRLEKPKLYAPLQKALEQAQLGSTATELEDSLGIADRIRAGVYISLTNDYFGSGLTSTSNELFQALQDEAQSRAPYVAAQANFEEANQAFVAYLTALAGTHAEIADVINNNAEPRFEQFPADVRDEVMEQFESFAAAAIQRAQTRAAALGKAGYFEMANLLNNQPQLFAGIEYGYSNEYAGANELRAKVVYEIGFANVNAYRRYAKQTCQRADGAPTRSASTCLHDFTSLSGVHDALVNGSRLAITIEHVQRSRLKVTVPNTAVTIDEPSSRSWVGSLTMGRYLDPLDSDDQKTRIDIAASYEDVSDDTARQDRGLATATLSRQLSNDWVMAIGLVYATKPEFREKTDKDLSLRLGVNYKFLRKPIE